ncbi:DUF2625 family protein [Chitinophaga silvatica]|uniref:DUF2625 family protein n=1 Tax=Chitinophaga silvatica TaxID=2282649 RepID=A0A3E1Y5M0_9BACT|nr:DUF2625 family protein [Chitinophaga silvatica]RFS20040.1 DUF2625 family protein [Chitinophaga silvatica]
MKSLAELINTKESSWKNLQNLLHSASNPITILPKNEERAAKSLYSAQLSTRSPIGAVIFETGGILADHGWIRILGSGCPELDRSLPDWNIGKSYIHEGDEPLFLLIADDILGGFFAINTGGLEGQEGIGSVFYFTPDTKEWENMEIGYTDFIGFCCNGDVAGFYESFRFHGWEKAISNINGNQVVVNLNQPDQHTISISDAWNLSEPFTL